MKFIYFSIAVCLLTLTILPAIHSRPAVQIFSAGRKARAAAMIDEPQTPDCHIRKIYLPLVMKE